MVARKSTGSRNPVLGKNVPAVSRSKAFKRSGRWAKKADQWKKVTKTADAPVTKTFGKGKRTILPKGSRWYPAEDVKRPLANRKAGKKTSAKLRASITPGTVLILVAGRFRGRRVVFLKQLESGLLLVTGPYALNGVPFRRVNQRYAIATSTKVDLSGVTVSDKLNDAFFAKQKKDKNSKTEGEFFGEEKQKKELNPERLALQKSLDSGIISSIKKVEYLDQYLKSVFSLDNGQFAHNIKF